MDFQVNWIAVLLAAVASMVLGFAWYSPMLFGKPWMKLKGYTAEGLKKEQKEMGKWYFVSFVLAVVSAFVLSHVMMLSENFYQYDSLTTGIMSAFWMWLGFVMPTQMTAMIFGDKKMKLFGIDTGYQLVSLIVMGIVLGLF
jgi:hypothetical protein